MYRLLFIPLVLFVSSCVGDYFIDDFVQPVISINPTIDTIAVGESAQLEYRYLNNIGQLQNIASVIWGTSDPSIISVSENGVITGVQKGAADIIVSATESDISVSDTYTIIVGDSTVASEISTNRSGVLRSTSQYLLKGSFTLAANDDGALVLTYGDDYEATRALPELHGFLSNNPNSFQDAYDLGETTVFEGAHSITIGPEVDISDYSYITYWCVPFRVKVGDATIEE